MTDWQTWGLYSNRCLFFSAPFLLFCGVSQALAAADLLLVLSQGRVVSQGHPGGAPPSLGLDIAAAPTSGERASVEAGGTATESRAAQGSRRGEPAVMPPAAPTVTPRACTVTPPVTSGAWSASPQRRPQVYRRKEYVTVTDRACTVTRPAAPGGARLAHRRRTPLVYRRAMGVPVSLEEA